MLSFAKVGKQINRLFHSTWLLLTAGLILTTPAVYATSVNTYSTNQGLDAPMLLSPFNNAYIKGTSLPMAQKWSEVSGATGYDYESCKINLMFADCPTSDKLYSTTTTLSGRHIGVGAAETEFWWHVRATNIATGQKSNWSTAFKITIDKTAPDAFPVSPANGAFVNGKSVYQEWGSTASDVSYFVYESYHDALGNKLRWRENITATNKTAKNVSDASYWWRVKAVDKAGNESQWSSLSKITVDSTKPSKPAFITVAQNGVNLGCSGYTNLRSITVDWDNAIDANFKHYVYQADDGVDKVDFETTLVPSQRTGDIRDIDGTYQYRVKAVDKAGNESGWTNWCQITLDRIAPVVGFSGLTTTDTTPPLSGTINDDLASVEVIINNMPYSAVVSSGTWSIANDSIKPLDVGSYNVTINSTDMAGNTNSQLFSGNSAVLVQSSTVTAQASAQSTNQESVNNSPAPQENNVSTNTTVAGVSVDTEINQEAGADTGEEAITNQLQEDDGTEVEGLTSAATQEAGQQNFANSSNGFNWWWLLALVTLLIISYGVYRFASEESEA
jgi:hypothetical protein